MGLATARCSGCSQPLGDPPPVRVAHICAACGTTNNVAVTADGQAVEFDAHFSPARLVKWMTAARAAVLRGQVGIAVGVCTRCEGPLTIPAETLVCLPCPHCQQPIQGTAEEVLMDLWPEPYATAEAGAETSLEFRLALLDRAEAEAAGCAHCGAPTPVSDASMTCRRCGSIAWVERPSGKRAQIAVRTSGTRQALPCNQLLPISQGELLLRGTAQVGSSERSSSLVLAYAGVGCAVVAAICVLVGLILGMVSHYSK